MAKKKPRKSSRSKQIKKRYAIQKAADKKREKKQAPIINQPPEEQPFSFDNLKVTAVNENTKVKPKMTQAMEMGLIPKVGESTILCGASGSGKTNLLLYMLTNEHIMPTSLFKEIWLFSPSGKADKSFKLLNIDDDRIITENM